MFISVQRTPPPLIMQDRLYGSLTLPEPHHDVLVVLAATKTVGNATNSMCFDDHIMITDPFDDCEPLQIETAVTLHQLICNLSARGLATKPWGGEDVLRIAIAEHALYKASTAPLGRVAVYTANLSSQLTPVSISMTVC